MSHFPRGAIYVIVRSSKVTDEMIDNMKRYYNCIGDASSNSCRKSIDTPERTLLKIKTPVTSNVFNGFEWCNKEEIIIQVSDGSW